jgi:prevent-host-death family protein
MIVSVRTLKNRLSEYLRRVQLGQPVVVTDHGRPIAELTPLGTRRLSPRQRLQRLVELGEVSEVRGRRLRDIRPIRIRGRPLSETILRDRR